MAEPGISGPVTLGAKLLNDKSKSMKLAGSIRDRSGGGTCPDGGSGEAVSPVVGPGMSLGKKK